MFSGIQPFDLMDLAGKTLEMFTSQDGPVILLAGRDTKTGVIYVIAEKIDTEAEAQTEAKKLQKQFYGG